MIGFIFINVFIGSIYIFHGKKLRITKGMSAEALKMITITNFLLATIIMCIFFYVGLSKIFPLLNQMSLDMSASNKDMIIDKPMLYTCLYLVTAVIDITVIYFHMKNLIKKG